MNSTLASEFTQAWPALRPRLAGIDIDGSETLAKAGRRNERLRQGQKKAAASKVHRASPMAMLVLMYS